MISAGVSGYRGQTSDDQMAQSTSSLSSYALSARSALTKLQLRRVPELTVGHGRVQRLDRQQSSDSSVVRFSSVQDEIPTSSDNTNTALALSNITSSVDSVDGRTASCVSDTVRQGSAQRPVTSSAQRDKLVSSAAVGRRGRRSGPGYVWTSDDG